MGMAALSISDTAALPEYDSAGAAAATPASGAGSLPPGFLDEANRREEDARWNQRRHEQQNPEPDRVASGGVRAQELIAN